MFRVSLFTILRAIFRFWYIAITSSVFIFLSMHVSNLIKSYICLFSFVQWNRNSGLGSNHIRIWMIRQLEMVRKMIVFIYIYVFATLFPLNFSAISSEENTNEVPIFLKSSLKPPALAFQRDAVATSRTISHRFNEYETNWFFSFLLLEIGRQFKIDHEYLKHVVVAHMAPDRLICSSHYSCETIWSLWFSTYVTIVEFWYANRNINQTEALKRQMEVRRRLNEQLEVNQKGNIILSKPTIYSIYFNSTSRLEGEWIYVLDDFLDDSNRYRGTSRWESMRKENICRRYWRKPAEHSLRNMRTVKITITSLIKDLGTWARWVILVPWWTCHPQKSCM